MDGRKEGGDGELLKDESYILSNPLAAGRKRSERREGKKHEIETLSLSPLPSRLDSGAWKEVSRAFPSFLHLRYGSVLACAGRGAAGCLSLPLSLQAI